MTLLDCISDIDENAKRVNVYWHDELVTYYDGKNSINERYNNCKIDGVFYDDDENIYYIDLAPEMYICPKCGRISNWDELIGTDDTTDCPECGLTSNDGEWKLLTADMVDRISLNGNYYIF